MYTHKNTYIKMYTLKRFLLHVTQVKLLSDNSCGLSSHECACKTADSHSPPYCTYRYIPDIKGRAPSAT